jgi:hypothetical protein
VIVAPSRPTTLSRVPISMSGQSLIVRDKTIRAFMFTAIQEPTPATGVVFTIDGSPNTAIVQDGKIIFDSIAVVPGQAVTVSGF